MRKNFTGIQRTMSFKLLLTDVTSPLGRALEHELEREPFKLLMPTAAELDWSDVQSLPAYLHAHQPNLVLNCRGWDEAFHCGGQTELVGAARQLAQACADIQIPLIQLSS